MRWRLLLTLSVNNVSSPLILLISIWANLRDRVWDEDCYWHYQCVMCLAPWPCVSIINHHYTVTQEKEWGINSQRYIKNIIFLYIHWLKMSLSIMLWKLFEKYLQYVSVLSHLSLWYFSLLSHVPLACVDFVLLILNNQNCLMYLELQGSTTVKKAYPQTFLSETSVQFMHPHSVPLRAI